MKVRIKVTGKFEEASKVTEATVTIDTKRAMMSVRPLYSRREYDLPLDEMAEILVQRILRHEAHNTFLKEKE
jgi:hypothetical protein